MQYIERANTRPEADIELLRKAAKNLRNAASRINGVGWYGARAVQNLAAELQQMNYRLPSKPILGAERSTEALADFLNAIAERLNHDALSIDANAPGVMKAFEDDTPPGRPGNAPTKTHAYFTAVELGKAYEDLSGKAPGKSTDRITGKATGKFLEFVKDVFEILEINASPENTIKKAFGEKSEKN